MFGRSRSAGVRTSSARHQISRAVGCAYESLETRTLFSTIVWDNRATTDNFGIYPNAALARTIVDRAINDWERVITNFNYSGGGNTYHVDVFAGPISGRGATDNAVYNAQGKPTSADIFLDDNGEGGGWFFDPDPGTATVPDDSEYTTWITPFAADGAGVGNDFYRTIVHELGHAMGILVGTAGVASGNPAINGFLTDTGIDDPNDFQGATLRSFNVGGGAVEATLTETGGGHLYEGPAVGGGLTTHPNDLLNAGRTVATGLNRRQLISDTDAMVLDLAYGYTIVMPSQINTFHANLNTVTNVLNIVGAGGSAVDSVTLDNLGGYRAQVNGTSEIIPTAEVNAIVINTGAGNDTIRIGTGDIDTDILDNTTVTGGSGTDLLIFNDTTDTLDDDYTLTSSTFTKSSMAVDVTFGTVENVRLDASDANNTINVPTFSNISTGLLSLVINANDGNDAINIASGDVENNLAFVDLSVNGGLGIDSIFWNDASDAEGNDGYTLTTSTFDKTTLGVGDHNYNAIESVRIDANPFDNTINLNGAPANGSIVVNGGDGNDTYEVGDGDIDSALTFVTGTLNGQGGSNTLNLNDTTDGAGVDTWDITANTFDKGNTGIIQYANFRTMLVDASANDDTITATGFGAFPTIHANGGDDTIDIDGSYIGASTIVQTGAGNDVVRINTDGVGSTPVRFNLSETLSELHVGAGGLLDVEAGGTKVLRINDLVSLGGRINLEDNFFIREAGATVPSLTSYVNWCTNGYNGGDWLGAQPAFISTPGDATNFALGYAKASALFGGGGGVFAGQLVSADAICVRFTRYGDANLDGTVNLQDFNRLAGSFGQVNTVWSQGNFNYDNTTNLQDFNKLAGNFGLSAAPDGLPQGPQMTQPELRKLLDDTTGGAVDVIGRRWSRSPIGAGSDLEVLTKGALARTA